MNLTVMAASICFHDEAFGWVSERKGYRDSRNCGMGNSPICVFLAGHKEGHCKASRSSFRQVLAGARVSRCPWFQTFHWKHSAQL